MLDVNLSGAFHMSRGALRHMLDRGTGRIINISSIAGETGNVGQANDAASKAGLIGLTKTLARKSGFLVAKAGKLTDDSVAIYRERGDTRPGRHRDARPHPSEGPRPARRPDPQRAPRACGGGRARRALPGCRCLVIHHWTGLGRQRRDGHVTALQAGRGYSSRARNTPVDPTTSTVAQPLVRRPAHEPPGAPTLCSGCLILHSGSGHGL